MRGHRAWIGGVLLATLVGGLVLLAQGSSFQAPFPILTANGATGLQVNNAAGKIAVGGLIQPIAAGTVTTTTNMTSCQAPYYSACNFVYWPGTGTALATTTAYETAYAPGNVVIGFVTTTVGGNISTIVAAPINVQPTISIGGYWVSPGDCNEYASANGTTVSGLTTIGTNNIWVNQVATTNSGTNTHTYQCNISPVVRPSAVIDATFYYGNNSGSVASFGTQAAVLNSGTFNGTTVFTSITYPVPATFEIVSTVTPVRADTGTLTITPTAANFQITSTTAGSFWSARFTPSVPIAVTSDFVQLLFTVTLQMQATTGSVSNSPGVFVRYSR